MPERHEPREAFVNDLAVRLTREMGARRNAPVPVWWMRSRTSFAAALVAVVLVSMAAGGGVVVMAYQVQSGAQRSTLISLYEQRLQLAERQAALAEQRLTTMTQRVAVGGETNVALEEARAELQSATGDLRIVRLQLEEVRASGIEPQDALSAPRVASRDFVAERLRVQLETSASAIKAGELRLKYAQVRMDNGISGRIDVQTAGARLFGERAMQVALQKKIQIREGFIAGRVSAAITDLRGLEADVESRRMTLAQEIELAGRVLEDLKLRAQIGTSQPLDVNEADVHLRELQLAASKADYDLAIIRQQIGRAK